MKKICLTAIITLVWLINFAQINLGTIEQNSQQPTTAAQAVQTPQQISSSEAQQGFVHDITMYPKIAGMIKHAIFLEAQPDEKFYKIELYAVKSASVDDCNKHFLIGEFETKNLEGWGYDYYIFQSNGSIMSTKMACIKSSYSYKDVASSQTQTTRYISAIPLIVYAPQGVNIKYKLWKQEPKEYDAKAYE